MIKNPFYSIFLTQKEKPKEIFFFSDSSNLHYGPFNMIDLNKIVKELLPIDKNIKYWKEGDGYKWHQCLIQAQTNNQTPKANKNRLINAFYPKIIKFHIFLHLIISCLILKYLTSPLFLTQTNSKPIQSKNFIPTQIQSKKNTIISPNTKILVKIQSVIDSKNKEILLNFFTTNPTETLEIEDKLHLKAYTLSFKNVSNQEVISFTSEITTPNYHNLKFSNFLLSNGKTISPGFYSISIDGLIIKQTLNNQVSYLPITLSFIANIGESNEKLNYFIAQNQIRSINTQYQIVTKDKVQKTKFDKELLSNQIEETYQTYLKLCDQYYHIYVESLEEKNIINSQQLLKIISKRYYFEIQKLLYSILQNLNSKSEMHDNTIYFIKKMGELLLWTSIKLNNSSLNLNELNSISNDLYYKTQLLKKEIKYFLRNYQTLN